MADPKGPFTRWWQSDGGWLFADFDTLKEAVEHQAYSSGPVIVTRPVYWEPEERPPPNTSPVQYKVTFVGGGRGYG